MSIPSQHGTTDRSDDGRLARTLALATGVVFLAVGVLGFVPGITTHYSDMSFAGHMSHAKLLGVFQVSVLHNLVHLAFGVAGIALARHARTAVSYLIGGGVVYGILWIYGLVVGMDSKANFVPVNSADNWLHFLLAVGMIAMGLVARRAMEGRRDAVRT